MISYVFKVGKVCLKFVKFVFLTFNDNTELTFSLVTALLELMDICICLVLIFMHVLILFV